MKYLLVDDTKSPFVVFKNESIEFDPTIDSILVKKNALDGIEALKEDRYDVCLLDYHLNDGYEGSFIVEFLSNNRGLLPKVTMSISMDLKERQKMNIAIEQIYKEEKKSNKFLDLFLKN
jgi:hypothetical protein